MTVKVRGFFLLALFVSPVILINAQDGSDMSSTNAEANSAYVKAMHYVAIGNPRTGGSVDSLRIAVQLLEQSVKQDPSYAKAFLELSKTHLLFDFSYPQRSKYFSIDNIRRSKDAVIKALEIDGKSSEAYTQLSLINSNHEYNWNETLRNLDSARKYDTSSAFICVKYGQMLALKGNWKDAQEWIDKANLINDKGKNDNRVLTVTSVYYHWKRDYSKAIGYLKRINPPIYIGTFYIGLNLLAGQQFPEAVLTLGSIYPDVEQADGGAKALIAYALTMNGEPEKAASLVKRIYALDQVVKYRTAVYYISIHNYKKALKYLEDTYDERGNWLIWLKYDPALDPIRKEKRFKALMTKMKYY